MSFFLPDGRSSGVSVMGVSFGGGPIPFWGLFVPVVSSVLLCPAYGVRPAGQVWAAPVSPHHGGAIKSRLRFVGQPVRPQGMGQPAVHQWRSSTKVVYEPDLMVRSGVS